MMQETAPQIFDTSRLVHRQRRALSEGIERHFLDQLMIEDLADRLAFIERKFEKACLATPFDEHAKSVLAHHQRINALQLASSSLAKGRKMITEPDDWNFEHGSLSLIMCLHHFAAMNDLPGLLMRMRQSLGPDGLLMAAFLGGDTLSELRQVLLQAETEITGGAANRVHPMVDVRDAGALLQRAGFALPVADLESHKVRYDNMFALLQDLRSLGFTSALIAKDTPKLKARVLMRAAELYQTQFSDPDGRIYARFDIIWLSGWVPHESQQKPLKPGSATHRMADFLGKDDVQG